MSDLKNEPILSNTLLELYKDEKMPYIVHPVTKQLLFRDVRNQTFAKNGSEISFPIPGWYAHNSDVYILEKEDKILVERIKGLL